MDAQDQDPEKEPENQGCRREDVVHNKGPKKKRQEENDRCHEEGKDHTSGGVHFTPLPGLHDCMLRWLPGTASPSAHRQRWAATCHSGPRRKGGSVDAEVRWG